MDDTVYKIAIAGYLHDIGKFAERAKNIAGTDNTGFFPDESFLNNNIDLYQPFYNGRHTHSHATYTAAFIDHLEKILPKRFNKGEWGLGDSFINLAAGHHKPKTPLQWIIAIADRVSSGFDRAEFENKYNKEIEVRDYKKTRLLTIFEGLSPERAWKEDRLEDYHFRYPLKELSPQNIFPLNNDEIRRIDSEEASKEYCELFYNFINSLENLSHKDNIPLWFEHFDSLFMIFASHIPAATVGYVVPDVSLYDHSRMTSALASAIYKFHEETDTLKEEEIKNFDTKKFLLISGDFYGIQDFIFTEGGSTGKASAKLLRGRSFYVSLLSELAADTLCKELGLPMTSIILNAAGKFTILAYNTEKAKETIKKVDGSINNWLIKNFFGQVSIGISTVEASCNDFVMGNFIELWKNLTREVDRKKYKKFDLTKYSGCVSAYLDSFNNELGICPFCNKRPADKVASVKDEKSCRVCADQIYIGENLVKAEQIAITTTDAEIHGKKLLEPIFGKYQLTFPTGELKELSKQGKLIKFWNIGISPEGKMAKNITAKFINGYVPKYEDEDLYDDRYLAGRKSEKKKMEMIEQIKIDKNEAVPKTFAHIAVKALNFTEKPNKFKGIEALGILKADVDNLGLLFAYGVRKERFTISRLATMSRQMNNFFSLFLPYVLKTDERFRDTYTVFAGGDDLFLIGPWNKTIELANFINDKFREYVCFNSSITLSAGISLHKPGTPVLTFAETSEKALNTSKQLGRNRLTVFGQTVEWKHLKKIEEIKSQLEDWLNREIINNAMLFRLNELIEMKKQEEELKRTGFIHLEDMECLKWRARFNYTVVRNTGKKLKGEEKQKAIEEVMQIAEWLEDLGGALRIPLWQIIYNRR